MASTAANNTREQQVLTKIQSLVHDIHRCAPHPDRPTNGPEFLNAHDTHKQTADYDGMLGSMMMDSILGSSFFSAANDSFDLISEILKDRAKINPKPRYKLGQKGSISGTFNAKCDQGPEWEAMHEAYLQDLPKRKNLEKWLAHYTKELDYIRRDNKKTLPSLAA